MALRSEFELQRKCDQLAQRPYRMREDKPHTVSAIYAEKRVTITPDRGFTIVELVMTMVVIAILAVFAISRLDFQSAFSERGFHDRLKAGLQFARKAAVAQRRYVCVTAGAGYVEFKFNPTDIESVATPPGSCTNNLALPAPDSGCGGANNRICAPSGVSVSGSSFYFDARGGASAAATFSMTGQPDITVALETGYVN